LIKLTLCQNSAQPSTKGAEYDSPRQRPGFGPDEILEALKARNGKDLLKVLLILRPTYISRFQRWESSTARTWADGPGYYSSRLWRWTGAEF
jgi:hypothetical protein